MLPYLCRQWAVVVCALSIVIAAPVVATAQTLQRLYLPIVGRELGAHETAVHSSQGSPIAVSPDGAAIWVVNPDADSVTVVSTQSLHILATIPVEDEPWSLAIAPDGTQVYVLNRAAGSIAIVDAHSYTLKTTIAVGPEPGQIALNPSGTLGYVTLTTANQVAILDTLERQIIRRVPVAARPYAIAVTNDGDDDDGDEQVLVTHLQALPAAQGSTNLGQITVLDSDIHQPLAPIHLQPNIHGVPNRLTAIAVAGDRAWVPMVRSAPEEPNGLTTTIFPAVATINLATRTEESAAGLPLNDQEIFGSPINNPHALASTVDGRRLYIALAGSNQIEVVDIAQPSVPRLVKFLPVGYNPRGVALSPDQQTGYVMNFLSRSITVLDLKALEVVAEVAVADETLEPEILHGKRLFNQAADPKLSHGSWFSCASCHLDGGTDGVTWITADGPRQTPPLWAAGESGPWHWSATFDELQDVEDTIQRLQHGLGLAPGMELNLLATPNAKRSADLDALAAYVERGIRPPDVPAPEEPDAAAQVSSGRHLFVRSGCHACHGTPAWTSSRLQDEPGRLDIDGNHMIDVSLHDVGTLHPLDVRGAQGFDSPSLLGVGLTAPYFHDGSMQTVEALLASGHPTPGQGNELTIDELADLAAFVRSIGPNTTPVNIAEKSNH